MLSVAVNQLCFLELQYAESNADKVMELFNEWIKDEITASHSIYCIGFYFPTRVNSQNFQFKKYISFSFAQFKEANFSDAAFRSITQFIKSDFEGERVMMMIHKDAFNLLM